MSMADPLYKLFILSVYPYFNANKESKLILCLQHQLHNTTTDNTTTKSTKLLRATVIRGGCIGLQCMKPKLLSPIFRGDNYWTTAAMETTEHYGTYLFLLMTIEYQPYWRSKSLQNIKKLAYFTLHNHFSYITQVISTTKSVYKNSSHANGTQKQGHKPLCRLIRPTNRICDSGTATFVRLHHSKIQRSGLLFSARS